MTAKVDTDTQNGATHENFSWSQSIFEVDMKITVPKSVLKGKHVKVSLKGSNLRVQLVATPETEILVEGELEYDIGGEDKLSWTLTPGEYILLTLEKPFKVQKMWTRLFKWETELEAQNLLNEAPFESLEEEEQQKIQELMWKQRQKYLVQEGLAGKETLATTQDQKTLAMLKEAWDKDGSPFKGTPFNPDVLQSMGSIFSDKA
ncbi:unnamed protein product [Notodromas monacha]|uniref:CS domain-containing protein n=1 Tax=Notodromas monacha TaxID=399045 RepID=A0A7R9BU65_9CRUS|nr:unnamed protein product [Notodromas monacha]CAG0920257.1 unnamed protein product [Notodromas monacha]